MLEFVREEIPKVFAVAVVGTGPDFDLRGRHSLRPGTRAGLRRARVRIERTGGACRASYHVGIGGLVLDLAVVAAIVGGFVVVGLPLAAAAALVVVSWAGLVVRHYASGRRLRALLRNGLLAGEG